MIKKYINIATLSFLSSLALFGCSNNESTNLIKTNGEIEKTSTNGYKIKFSYDETQGNVLVRANLNGTMVSIGRENLPNELLRIKNGDQLFHYLNANSAYSTNISDV